MCSNSAAVICVHSRRVVILNKQRSCLERRRSLTSYAMAFSRGWTGSQRGYNGDIDHSSSSSSDDDDGPLCSAASSVDANSGKEATSTSSSIQFYKDVQPRRRRCYRHQPKKINRQTCITHPDIDLSLVSLLTSTEHERKQLKKLRRALQLNRRSDDTQPEYLHFSSFNASHGANCLQYINVIDDDSSSPSSSSSEGSITECGYPKGFSVASKNNRPLAVIDYGAVQFGQLGSILDSVYNMKTADDKLIGRKGIHREPPYVDCNGVKSNSFSPQQAVTAVSSRSSEVGTVIASLKNTSTGMKRKTRNEGTSSKKVKFTPISTDTTTLDDAVSFSPYARVLFTADSPQTVVHTNAAYGTLVKKGFAKPCAFGYTLSAFKESVKLNEDVATRIVSQELGLSTKNVTYQLFPIISSDERFCSFSQTNLSCCDLEKTVEEGIVNCARSHVSHYLLQIEPFKLG